jgi:hypothetical protein
MNKRSSSGRLQELFGLYKSGTLALEEFDLLKKQIIAGDESQQEDIPPSIAIESEHEAKTMKLLHELEEHKIELEDLFAEKYVQLFDFAPNGYFSLTQKGEIIEVNLRGQSIGRADKSYSPCPPDNELVMISTRL